MSAEAPQISVRFRQTATVNFVTNSKQNSNKITNVSEMLTLYIFHFGNAKNNFIGFGPCSRETRLAKIELDETMRLYFPQHIYAIFNWCSARVFWALILFVIVVCVCALRCRCFKDVAGRPFAATDAHDDSLIDCIISVFVCAIGIKTIIQLDGIVVTRISLSSIFAVALPPRISWVSHEGNIDVEQQLLMRFDNVYERSQAGPFSRCAVRQCSVNW